MDQNILIEGTVKIVNGPIGSDTWAKSFPPDTSDRPPFFMDIPFDNGSAGVFERWQIKRFEDGFTIQNVGNEFWAYGKDGETFTSNEFDAGHCKWHLARTGHGIIYNIKVPNQDLVWTLKRRDPDHRLSVFLEPAGGNDNQNFHFERQLDD